MYIYHEHAQFIMCHLYLNKGIKKCHDIETLANKFKLKNEYIENPPSTLSSICPGPHRAL